MDFIKNINEKILKIGIILSALLFSIPSIIYYIKNGTVLNFKEEYCFLLNNQDTLIQTIVYIAILISFTIFYYLIIKKNKEIFKNIKQILYFAKDLIFNKVVQRVVNIYYTSVASSFGTNIYAIHCVCVTIIDTLCEIIEGYYSGLLVQYSNDIENKTDNFLKKVDTVELYGNILAIAFIPIFIYPLWLILGNKISWENCNPYIWIYSIEFIAEVAGCNYRAYLSANKNTKAIRMMAFIGGICVRVPLCYLIQKYNIGLIGLAFVCGIDRIVRAIYLRLYIKFNKTKLFV